MSVKAQLLSVLPAHADVAWHVAWAPSGTTLATAGSDHVVRLWEYKGSPAELADSTPLDLEDADEIDSTTTCDTDECGSGCNCRERPAGWRLVQTLQGFTHRTVRGCEFSPRGDMLATAGFDGKVWVWMHRPGRPKPLHPIACIDAHKHEVKSLAWSSDGTLLATCGRDQMVRVWQAPLDPHAACKAYSAGRKDGGFACIAAIRAHRGDAKSVRFQDGTHVLVSTGYDNVARLWAVLRARSDSSSDGSSVVSQESNTECPRMTHSLKCLALLRGHEGTVWGAAFADARPGLTAGSDNSVRVYPSVVTCSDDSTVRVWDIHSAEACGPSDHEEAKCREAAKSRPTVNDAVVARHSRATLSVDLHQQSGSIVSAGGDNTIVVTKLLQSSGGDLVTAEVTRTEDAHEADVNCVRWNPRLAGVFASCGDDGSVRVWGMPCA